MFWTLRKRFVFYLSCDWLRFLMKAVWNLNCRFHKTELMLAIKVRSLAHCSVFNLVIAPVRLTVIKSRNWLIWIGISKRRIWSISAYQGLRQYGAFHPGASVWKGSFATRFLRTWTGRYLPPQPVYPLSIQEAETASNAEAYWDCWFRRVWIGLLNPAFLQVIENL